MAISICLLSFKNSPAMAQQYIKINNINFIKVYKNFDNRWAVGEMWKDSIGCPAADFRTKREAIEFANDLAAIGNLNVIVE